MKSVRIGEFLHRTRDVVLIDDKSTYKRVTIKTRNQGVFLRDEVPGSTIGTKNQFTVKSGQFILSKIDARLGAFGIVPENLNGAIVTPDFPSFEFDLAHVNPVWFNLFTSTRMFIEICKAASRGVTNRQRLKEDFFLNYKILLPSKPEQDEIVEKLHQLQALHAQANATLTRLQADVKRLRQSILQQAIQGKLVDNTLPSGEKTGAELLADIRAEKERRAREQGKKPDKPLPPVTEEEMPFELPEGWVWCRLGDICDRITDGFHHTPPKVLKGAVYISATHVKPEKIDWDNCQFIPWDWHDSLFKKAKPSKGEILMINRGAGCGLPAIIDSDVPFSFQNVALIGFNQSFLSSKYLFYFLVMFRDEVVEKYSNGGLQPMLSLKSLEGLTFPLPNFDLQEKIATVLESRLSHLDKFNQQLTALQIKIERLWQSEMQQIFKFESNGEASN